MNTHPSYFNQAPILALAFCVIASVASLWGGARVVSFDVPEGRLAVSLQEASRQAEVEILISGRIPERVRGVALRGEYSVEQAFSLLLEGSGWVAVPAAGGSAFAIVERKPEEGETVRQAMSGGAAKSEKKGLERFFRNVTAAFSGKRGVWASVGGGDDGVFLLSPFEVLADEDVGYVAANTLSGTRLNSAVKDLGNTMTILTPKFWEDTGVTSVNDLILFTPGSEKADTQQDRGNADLLFWGDTTIFRGVHTENIMRNQFRSNLPSDTYNAERFEFLRGPNAVLFGINREPAGLVNRTTQDALFQDRAELKVRVDEHGSWRSSANLNRVILEDRLAARLAVLTDRNNHWIEQGFQDQDRYYWALNYQANDRLSVKTRVETLEWERSAVDPSYPKDHVSAWIRAGRPGVDVSAADEEVEFPVGTTVLSALNNYGLVNDGSGRMVNLRNYAVGDESLLLSGDVASVPDDWLPLEYNISGGFASQSFSGDNAQLVAQYQVSAGLSLEYAINSEYMLYDFISAENEELYVDVNTTLDDGFTPNPHFGELLSLATFDYRLKQDRYLRAHRLSASFSHDFSGNDRMGFLGKHQGALVLERNTDEFYWDVLRLINVTPPDDEEGRDQDRAATVLTYLDPARKSYSGPTSAIEFQGILNSISGNDYRWLNGESGGNVVNRTEIGSTLFVWQGSMFDRRLIPTVGWRRDSIDQFDTAPLKTPRASAREQGYRYRPEISGLAPQTMNKGVVMEVIRDWGSLDYVSLFYSEADSFAASNFGRAPDNSTLPPRIGETEDYGLRFGLGEGSVSGVFTVFETSTMNDLMESTLETKALLGDLFGMIGRHDLNNIPQVNDILDRISEGWEFQLTANLFQGWRMMFSVDHFKTYESDVAPYIRRLISEYSPSFLEDPDRIVPDQGTKTAGEVYAEMIDSLNLRLAQVGGFKNNERRNKATLLSTYEFQDGPLKGVSLGGSLIWRDKPATGFAYREDDQLGLLPDVEDPFFGEELLNLSVHAAYEMPVVGGRARWKIQLNVSNLGDEKPFVIRHSAAESDPQRPILQSVSKGNPQVVVLTNTLTF